MDTYTSQASAAYAAMVTTNGNMGTDNAAPGSDADISAMAIRYERTAYAGSPKSGARGPATRPAKPAVADSSIARGTRGNARIFAGSDTSEKRPV